MATEAEAAVNALKKLEANKTCVNCGNYNRFGHQNICEKVHTFVCSTCKSAHQSFSMRVKSVSMSNWTMEEVNALREQNGGGNAVAARVWYGRWDENQMRRPTKDDSLDYYKLFINRVYNDKAFYDENGYTETAVSSSPTSKKSSDGQAVSPTRAISDSSPNLLDFDTPVQTKASTEIFDAFSDDGWGKFAAAPVPAPAPNVEFGAFTSATPTTSTSSNNVCGNLSAAPSLAPTKTDAFGAFVSAPPPASTSTFFDPFAGSSGNVLVSSNAPSSGSATSLNSFSPAPSNQSQQPTPNPMSQFQTSPAPKDFSVFDKLSTPSPAYGTSQSNSNVYRQAHGSSEMRIHGHGQQQSQMGMNTGLQQGIGMQHCCGGFQYQQQHHYQQSNRSGNAGMNISTYFSPSVTGENGCNSTSRSNSRDPFAGLGL